MHNNSGTWGDGHWFPPRSLSDADFGMLRAGTELAIRRCEAPGVVAATVDAMDDPDVGYRGASALLAAYLGERLDRKDEVRDRLETMAEKDSCTKAEFCNNYSFESSAQARVMAKAALLVLGDDEHHAEVTAGLENGDDRVRMVCAAALGLVGEDAPVLEVLVPLVEDDYGFVELYAPYLLRLVVADRRGPSGNGPVSFYGDEGIDPGDSEDTGCGCGRSGRPAPILAFAFILLAGLCRRAVT
jgi:hypothetical protein